MNRVALLVLVFAVLGHGVVNAEVVGFVPLLRLEDCVTSDEAVRSEADPCPQSDLRPQRAIEPGNEG